ncbi:MAG: FAD-dependent oxidoreductase [Planctomycetota bacterium]
MSTLGRASTIIVGSGLAGAAVAHALVLRGHREVLVLEREKAAGLGSSGKSAGMIRQVVESAAIARLATESARACAVLAEQGAIAFEVRGSFLMGPIESLERLLKAAPVGSPANLVSRSFIKERMNGQFPPGVSQGIFSPGDGVVDVDSVLAHFRTVAQRGGAQFLDHTEVTGLVVKDGRAAGVETKDGSYRASTVVDAAGAWAAEWLPLASRPQLKHFRRHIFVSDQLGQIPADAPYLWDIDHGFYYRPEGSGLLLCICDGDEQAPGHAAVDGKMAGRLRSRCREWLPDLPEFELLDSWAGLRSFSPDGHFLLGPVAELPGLQLACGLGGHGVSCAYEVGRLVAAAIDGETLPEIRPFLPDRFREIGIES